MARQLYIVDDNGQIIDLRDKVFLIDSNVDIQDAETYGIRLDNFNVGNCFMGDEE
jgi:predicted amidohydrolase